MNFKNDFAIHLRAVESFLKQVKNDLLDPRLVTPNSPYIIIKSKHELIFFTIHDLNDVDDFRDSVFDIELHPSWFETLQVNKVVVQNVCNFHLNKHMCLSKFKH